MTSQQYFEICVMGVGNARKYVRRTVSISSIDVFPAIPCKESFDYNLTRVVAGFTRKQHDIRIAFADMAIK